MTTTTATEYSYLDDSRTECTAAGAPIAVSTQAGSGPPNGWPVPTGTIEHAIGQRTIAAPGPGPLLLAIQLNAGVCLRAIRGTNPIPADQEWWVTTAGEIRGMARGGGAPQCAGPCPWYSRVSR